MQRYDHEIIYCPRESKKFESKRISNCRPRVSIQVSSDYIKMPVTRLQMVGYSGESRFSWFRANSRMSTRTSTSTSTSPSTYALRCTDDDDVADQRKSEFAAFAPAIRSGQAPRRAALPLRLHPTQLLVWNFVPIRDHL